VPPEIRAVVRNAATAGPRSPGKWLTDPPGVTTAPLRASGIQYAQESAYVRTTKVRTG
jgi:hypothetical protein